MKKLMATLTVVLLIATATTIAFAQDKPENKCAKKEVVKVSGVATQQHSTFVGTDGNSAGGWGSSTGTFNAKETGKKGDHVNGKADANGSMSASVTSTPNGNSSTVNSSDDSKAKVRFCGNGQKQSTVMANGGGEVGAQSTLGGATAGIYGGTTYNAKGPNGAHGSDVMSGSTSASQTGNTISSTANVSATTKAGSH